MEWLAFVLAAGTSILLARKLRVNKKKLERYKPIVNIENYVSKVKQEIAGERSAWNSQRASERQKLDGDLAAIKLQLASSQSELTGLQKSIDDYQDRIDLLDSSVHLLECGYYEPEYNFEWADDFEKHLKDHIRNKVKEMISNVGKSDTNAAAYIVERVTYGDSASKGAAMQKKVMRLMLRAFNGESDAAIAKVNYKNVTTQEKRIEKAFEAIDKMGRTSMFCALNSDYLDLKIQELHLIHEWEEKKEKEREEQRRIKEQIREEERAQLEFQKALQDAEQEEKRFAEALEKARSEVSNATEQQKTLLNQQIAELEARIQEMEEQKRAISQAQLTKAGYVYIISNIGSFGDNVFKIGMTRRREPMDRVKELGDASVPFPFDVHALISTSDAPSLENALHHHFDERRLNLENHRKEFFRVSIDEIKNELKRLESDLNIDSEIRLTLLAEAKEYRLSEARRKHLESSFAGSP
jgi:hypothetical protein